MSQLARHALLPFLTLLVLGTSAVAQPLHGTAQSLEAKLVPAQTVVTGTVVDFDNEHVTLKVAETLRGEHVAELKLPRAAHSDGSQPLTREQLAEWKNSSARLLVASWKSEGQQALPCINLDDERLEVLNKDFELLTTPDEVLKSARIIIETYGEPAELPQVLLKVPDEVFARSNWRHSATMLSLTVPVDEQWCQRAIDDNGDRAQAAVALRHFRSDENEARLRALLKDSKTAFSRTPIHNNGLGTYQYIVRQAALSTLTAWGVDVTPPVLQRDFLEPASARYHDLSRQEISADILAQIASFAESQDVDFSHSSITDQQLSALAEADLRIVNLADTDISDDGIEALLDHPELRVLILDGTRITSEGASRLAQLPNLKKVSLNHTSVSDEAISKLAALEDLTFLGVSDTGFTDDVLSTFLACEHLLEIACRDTTVTRDHAKAFRRAYKAKYPDPSIGFPRVLTN